MIRRWGPKVLYWLAVVIVSIAVLIGLILLLESRDESSVDRAQAGGGPTSGLSTSAGRTR
jgi:preprotein translocase subunit SecG